MREAEVFNLTLTRTPFKLLDGIQTTALRICEVYPYIFSLGNSLVIAELKMLLCHFEDYLNNYQL